MDTEELKRELSAGEKWIRLLFIVIYAILWQVAEIVLAVTVVLQFLWTLFGGAPNPSLREFGQRLGTWLHQVVDFLTYVGDQRPWPFGLDWPPADLEFAANERDTGD